MTCVQVSSLGDEMYYTIDCEGGPGGVAGAGAVVGRLARLTFKHQHSLESYQLYKVLYVLLCCNLDNNKFCNCNVAGEADEDPGEAGHDARLEPGEQTPGQSGQEPGDKTPVPAVRRQIRVRG